MRQHAQHREQERGGQELGREKQAQLREQRLDEREARAGERELARERGKRVRQRRPVAGVRDSPGEEEGDPDRHVGEEVDGEGELDKREVRGGVVENKRLVQNGELEGGGGVVDGDWWV